MSSRDDGMNMIWGESGISFGMNQGVVSCRLSLYFLRGAFGILLGHFRVLLMTVLIGMFLVLHRQCENRCRRCIVRFCRRCCSSYWFSCIK